MGLATTIARRSLLGRPGRTLFSVLGIALGIATVVAVRTLDHNTIAGMRLRGSGDWRPELEVRPAEGLGDPAGALRGLEGVAGASAFFQNEALVRPVLAGRGARPKAVRARLLAVDLDALPRMDACRLQAGALPDPEAREPEVLVGAALAEQLGLRPGSSVELSRPPRSARKACIDGVMREIGPAVQDAPVVLRFEVAGVLAREKLGRRAGGEVALVDTRWGRQLYEGARIEERYWVRPDPAVDLERLQQNLAGQFAYDIGRSAVVGQAADERAFRQGVFLAGLLALALGLYVIFHTLSMSLVERVREVATLHALGTTRAQIARVVLLEALVLALLGGVLGLIFGLGVAWLLLRAGLTTLGSGTVIELFEVPWSFVLPISGLGALLALAGAVFPLARARGSNTAEALRGQQALRAGATRGFHWFAAILLGGILPALYFTIVPVIGQPTRALVAVVVLGVGVLSMIVAVPLVVPAVVRPLVGLVARPLRALFPFAGRMAGMTMSADPRRVAVSTAAVTLVVAAFVGLKGMTHSLAGEIEEWSVEATADKVYAEGLPRVPLAELSRALLALPEVVGLEAGSARTYSPFLLLGLRTQDLAAYGPLARDANLRARFERGEGVILSGRLAQVLGYAVGDRVQLATGGGVRELEVLAVSDAYGYFPHPDERMYGVVDDRVMEHAFCLDVDTTDRVALRLAPGADAGVAIAALEEFVGGEGALELETGRALARRQIEDIDADFLLFDLILALTALLAAIGVLNGQLLAALERTRELGVLRALGASARQVAGMVLLESGVIGLLGGLAGVGLGLALGPLIVRGLEWVSGLRLPLRGPGEWAWLALGGAVLLTLAAALYPVFRMNRVDAVRAVRGG